MGGDSAKERAGRHAERYVEDGMRVGLGTGSTVHFTILALGERKPDITCVATSERTRRLAVELGLRVVEPDDAGALDVAIDGADAVDPALNLIKGGGGAHAREKIVAHMAARFIVVVDATKLVDSFDGLAVPLEVMPFAPAPVADWMRAAGAVDVRRRPELSDNGNLLLDAVFARIPDPVALAQRLDAIPGVVEHGLFPAQRVERVVVGDPDGVRELLRP